MFALSRLPIQRLMLINKSSRRISRLLKWASSSSHTLSSTCSVRLAEVDVAGAVELLRVATVLVVAAGLPLVLPLSSRVCGVLKRAIIFSTVLHRLLLLSRKCEMIWSPSVLRGDVMMIAKRAALLPLLLRRSLATMRVTARVMISLRALMLLFRLFLQLMNPPNLLAFVFCHRIL